MRGLFYTLLLLFTALGLSAAEPPKIVFLLGEYEYHSMKTLPVFAQNLQKKFNLDTVLLQRPEDPKLQTIPGLSALDSADLLIVYVRRMTLPAEELIQIKKYSNSGKPIIGLRTASHAFQNWKEWDREVLGGNYQGHRGNELKSTVSI